MTALTDQCDKIRLWLNEGTDEYPDALVETWIRGAEEDLSNRLRVGDMIQIDTASMTDGRFTLPADWEEMEMVRVVDGDPLTYKNRNDFYTQNEEGTYDNRGKYTIAGRFVEVGMATDAAPIEIEMTYFGRIPPLGDDANWISGKYPQLLLYSALHVGCLYGLEDDRASMWETKVNDTIALLNNNYKAARVSGTRLSYKSRKTFG